MIKGSQTFFHRVNHEIFLITSALGEEKCGMIATWIMPGTLVEEHPRLIGVFSPENRTTQVLLARGQFVAHLLAQEQLELVPLFGLRSSKEINKFSTTAHSLNSDGIPIVYNTCGWVKCKVINKLDLGDRIVVVSDIFEGETDSLKTPLLKEYCFSYLPPEASFSLLEKRQRDNIRDQKLMLHPS
ncbi:MAG: hypothetical protein COX62_00330 [Deltaproteobacteria bacterium CG_4_10_14_0_2_um_filter_43_8]|nr:MAG: hypothetical protein COV43_03590 [Deltaproteobacteria bacterium CG11_big_fil_rev_8_21_14_0_20_42_23]PJA22270.1 MAG: hypothetical protein COX62_00330 [Deltaproteobacteria bacterium CG_4_10_14_0_2_um_filter_43_8]PJC63511.1 MAG: hypothetical protein CO021_09250 [Deltaproteobacteria bacterium CG_4_9_14_0_2_um_filter_42_21]